MTGEPFGSPSPGCIEQLFAALVDCEDIHLVVKNDAATAEIRGRGTLRTGDEWLTVEVRGAPDHVHVRRGSLARAEFLVARGRNRGVRFLDDDGRPVITCHLPGTNEDASPYSGARRERFDRIEAAHRAAPWRTDRNVAP